MDRVLRKSLWNRDTLFFYRCKWIDQSMNVSLLVGPQWSADGDLRIQISETLEITHYSLGQTFLSDDVLDKVGQYGVSLNSSTGKRCYFSGCCTARKVIIPSFAGIGYRESKASKRFVCNSFYGHMWGWHRFPHEGDLRWILV